MIGSPKLLQAIYEKLLNRGEETLRNCLTNWEGQDGFECVYGALFELYCHRMIESSNGDKPLNMRMVFRSNNKNGKTIQVKLPQTSGTSRFKSNDPAILGEDQHEEAVTTLDKYHRPISRNFPTYDSVFFFEGKHFGVDKLKTKKIMLLLQMTVSGATGLPCRPDHSIKQHIRKKFKAVFNEKIPGFKEKGEAYTAFMVPTECFKPFLFQEEKTTSDSVAKVGQPEFQLVFGVPDAFHYKKDHREGKSMQRMSFLLVNGGRCSMIMMLRFARLECL
ncbi:hypothetical protein SEMRO_2761_G336460.1 [Seminavis robusta]|uniref:Uncharacterized protein n=1 Tax=Seminavis robusta TaxID=568900 RepID=A0A9N8HY97_9STRA|nr:hypothetical protein SEMRO_2761_G336460.1 [Seminavis robusta]|eukprot:Sro2761_g336460.1 n/a (276) ;mRNA; f:7614-8441